MTVLDLKLLLEQVNKDLEIKLHDPNHQIIGVFLGFDENDEVVVFFDLVRKNKESEVDAE